MNKDFNKLLEKEEGVFLEIEYTKKLEALKNENARLRAVLHLIKEEAFKINCLKGSNAKNDLSNK